MNRKFAVNSETITNRFGCVQKTSFFMTALFISSILFITACNEKDPKLQAELDKTKQELSQTQTALNAANEELSKVRSAIPVVFSKEIEIFDKSEEFKNKDPAADITESIISTRILSVDTGIQWLNDLIYNKMLGDDFVLPDQAKTQEIMAIQDPKARLQALQSELYNSNRKEIEQFEARANVYEQTMRYIGQRQNIISFEQNIFIDVGGAHPNGWTNYINIDATKKAIIDLNMAFGQENLAKVKDLLWENYKAYNKFNVVGPRENESDYFIQKAEFEPSEDFYFNVEGITFVYPPYAIGSYAEGEIKLPLPWEVVKDVLKPEYIW